MLIVTEGPWCALTEIAGGAMYENCTLPTFEMCVQEVIAGNRGFCIPNPRWQAPGPETLSHPTSSLSQLPQRQAGHIAGPGGCGFVLAREACC